MFKRFFKQQAVCPWWLCFTFDNPVRRFFHNPDKILTPFIQSGHNVIDIGAGMGYFSIPLAKLVGPTGHVTSIDIQQPMLSALEKRAKNSGVTEQITTHLASPTSLGDHPPADFILAFWMVHEVPNQADLFKQLFQLLKPNGRLLVVEPKIHVPKKDFLLSLATAEQNGLKIVEQPTVRLSRSALFMRNDCDL